MRRSAENCNKFFHLKNIVKVFKRTYIDFLVF